MGRKASAAWAEVRMSVTLLACSVAAAVIMIARAMKFENPIPTKVS